MAQRKFEEVAEEVAEVAEEVAEVAEVAEVEKVTKKRKLEKLIEGSIVSFKEKETGKTLKFDFNQLPKEIQTKFGPFGLAHKLGDSAAGKKGQAVIDSINKVWKGLMEADWSVRAPAAPKITKKDLVNRISGMSKEEAKAAKDLLIKLGISVD